MQFVTFDINNFDGEIFFAHSAIINCRIRFLQNLHDSNVLPCICIAICTTTRANWKQKMLTFDCETFISIFDDRFVYVRAISRLSFALMRSHSLNDSTGKLINYWSHVNEFLAQCEQLKSVNCLSQIPLKNLVRCSIWKRMKLPDIIASVHSESCFRPRLIFFLFHSDCLWLRLHVFNVRLHIVRKKNKRLQNNELEWNVDVYWNVCLVQHCAVHMWKYSRKTGSWRQRELLPSQNKKNSWANDSGRFFFLFAKN